MQRQQPAPPTRNAALMLLPLLLTFACGRAAQPSPTPPAAQSAEVGIPECDEYLRKQQACLAAKLGPEALAAANQTLEATRLKWRAMKADMRTTNTLAMTCALATRDATTAMQDLGCAW